MQGMTKKVKSVRFSHFNGDVCISIFNNLILLVFM